MVKIRSTSSFIKSFFSAHGLNVKDTEKILEFRKKGILTSTLVGGGTVGTIMFMLSIMFAGSQVPVEDYILALLMSTILGSVFSLLTAMGFYMDSKEEENKLILSAFEQISKQPRKRNSKVKRSL